MSNIVPQRPTSLVPQSFNDYVQIAEMFSKSNIVPQAFRGNVGDCMIAMDMAMRLDMAPMSVFQNIYVVHGKPSFSGAFYVACINKSGRFSPIEYEEKIDNDGKIIAVRVSVTQRSTGKLIHGPWVSLEMAEKEGWTKNNPKWSTMSDLMLRYRAASFFARTYCPDIMMGIPIEGEVEDIPSEIPDVPAQSSSDFNQFQETIFHATTEAELKEIAEELKMSTSVSPNNKEKLRKIYQKKLDSLKSKG